MITVPLQKEELKMIIAALGYVRHPSFIELSDRLQKTLWANQKQDAPS